MPTVELLTQTELTDANYFLARINGEWTALGTGFNGNVRAILVTPAGDIYAGGQFTLADGGTVNRVAKWNGSSWEALGSGVDSTVMCLCLGPDGTLYVGGFFTVAGGSTVNYVAKWNGSNWSALGAGFSNGVYALAFSPAGVLYAAGEFLTTGGSTVNHVARWNGSSWEAVGSGADAGVFALCFDAKGNLYAGGDFTTMDGSSINRIAQYDGSNWTALGTGCNATVFALKIGRDGRPVAAGQFTVAGGNTVNYIAEWTGASWAALGSGLAYGFPYTILPSADGLLYVGGSFEAAGGVGVADSLAAYIGSSWQMLDVNLPGTATVYTIAEDAYSNLYVGFGTAGTAVAAGVVSTAIGYLGTTKSFPKFTFVRSGGTTATLESIQNLTTGEKLLFTCALQDGETLEVNCMPTHRAVKSTFNPYALNSMLAISDFATFGLVPGENRIAVLVSTTGAPTITAFMQWDTAYGGAGAIS